MATVNDKIKKILAMIDGATTEGEARAASLALQRLLVANDMTLDEISLSDDAPEINETGEDVGKRVAIWVKALAHVIASNYRCESYFHVRHERDFWTNRQKITSKQVVFVGEAEFFCESADADRGRVSDKSNSATSLTQGLSAPLKLSKTRRLTPKAPSRRPTLHVTARTIRNSLENLKRYTREKEGRF